MGICPKGFVLKLANLGLKIPLKSQAEPSCANAKPSQAKPSHAQRFKKYLGKGLIKV